MKKKNKLILLTGLCLVVISVSSLWWYRSRQADYGIIGQFRYRVVDKQLLEQTYLSKKSFGYLITNSPIQGLEILDFTFHPDSQDVIVSIDFPIREVLVNSKIVRDNIAYDTRKKPLEIIRDTNAGNCKCVYIYYLGPKDVYRLLLP